MSDPKPDSVNHHELVERLRSLRQRYDELRGHL
jgi:hypothetical protein